jgi:hypothetical protein
MIAFSDPSYGEMVLHPPPLSYLTVLMVFFLPFKNLMIHISRFFSYVMFWIENSIFLFGFFMFEMFILPLAYLKVWFNIIMNSLGILRRIVNCLIYGTLGIPLMFFILCRDLNFLIKIL